MRTHLRVLNGSYLMNTNMTGVGPILFNIFLNDIFASLNETPLYNYADDSTICNSDENIENVKSHLVSMIKIAIDWFERNCMQANPEKI